MVTVNRSSRKEAQLMRRKKDRLSVVYCIQSESLGAQYDFEVCPEILVSGGHASVLAQSCYNIIFNMYHCDGDSDNLNSHYNGSHG